MSTCAAARRIVSLVPSTTESVCRFGAAARLVGCTRYCTEPSSDLASVARVGGTKNPSLDTVLSLRPDLVLGNAEENRPADLDWLQQRVPVLVQTPRSVPEALQCLRVLAQRLECEAAAAPLLQRIEARLGVRPLCSRRVYYAIWRKPWMSVNHDTFVHDVLASCGAINVCSGEERRYPEVPPDVAVARAVEVVLLASEPWPFDAEAAERLRAARTFGPARIVCCDGRDFSWHGVHLAVGLARAAALLAAC